MGIGSWGGGIVLGLVAVLWLVYLIPSWHKRQEYLATERNAVRLQQTLRILAQTAELPEEVRVEANAKSVASAQRILRDEEAKREAIRPRRRPLASARSRGNSPRPPPHSAPPTANPPSPPADSVAPGSPPRSCSSRASSASCSVSASSPGPGSS